VQGKGAGALGQLGACAGRRGAGIPGEAPLPCPVVGSTAIDAGTVARIVKARAAAAGFDPRALGRHISYAVLDEYLELGDPFEIHPLSGVL
jgi:hypothetical protein